MNGRLRKRYLLVAPVCFYRDREGRIWLDELWWHDLREHLTYLEDITVLAPCREISAPEKGMLEVAGPENGRLEFVALFPDGGLRKILPHLPAAARVAWKAVGRSELVHSGVAGWPIPVGAIVNPIAVIRGKPLIIIVESAFWRLQEGKPAGWKTRLRAFLNEKFARWTLHQARAAIYTHSGYRTSLPVGPNGTSIILPASWISEADLISLPDAGLSWDEKPADAHFIVASRLVREKGIPLLIDALMNLEEKGETINVDVMGSGPMKADLEGIAANLRNVRLRLLDPVPYGPSFMRTLRQYHAVIVPVTGDEQARILYDSFSQAVPIIAANTAGNREVVTHGGTGFLFEANNPAALSETLCHCADDLDGLRQAGRSALTVAAKHTHADMHGKRADFLRETFGQC